MNDKSNRFTCIQTVKFKMIPISRNRQCYEYLPVNIKYIRTTMMILNIFHSIYNIHFGKRLIIE